MSASRDLPPGRVLHFNESAWERLEEVLRAHRLDLMAEHVAEQRSRRYLVLDVDYRPDALDDLLRCLRANYFSSTADQIEEQTKPPRIPEPGLWGVVEARVPGLPTRRWVHHEEDRWICDNGLPVKYWDDLIDPVLVREGVA